MNAPSNRHPERATALVILMILVIMMAMIGAWSLSSSTGGLTRAGLYRARISAAYSAEEAVQKSAARIREIAVGNDPFHGDYGCERKTRAFFTLASGAPQPGPPACPSPCLPGTSNCVSESDADGTCPANAGLDQILEVHGVPSNVVCGFLGSTLANTQVMLARKRDQLDEDGLAHAVYLVTAVAQDPAGRRKIAQGVVVVPPSAPPYLAGQANVTE